MYPLILQHYPRATVQGDDSDAERGAHRAQNDQRRGNVSNQITGNVGLYLVCTELSNGGFNVMPTARNARGVDIVGYDDEGNSFTVQMKTPPKRNPVPFGKTMSHLPAD
jgi:hypothetical protein